MSIFETNANILEVYFKQLFQLGFNKPNQQSPLITAIKQAYPTPKPINL